MFDNQIHTCEEESEVFWQFFGHSIGFVVAYRNAMNATELAQEI